MGKLTGIKVIDLSVFLPGPMMTVMMADQGAEVIKVETTAGDPSREQVPFEAGQSVWFRNLNRGKKSVVLDLKSEAGKARLWRMIEDADVFVEGFRPGVMQRLGFDYAAVAARNPRIVYCSISGFGQFGALAQHPAHDMAAQALAGFLSVNGDRPALQVRMSEEFMSILQLFSYPNKKLTQKRRVDVLCLAIEFFLVYLHSLPFRNALLCSFYSIRFLPRN
jgi:crotonobetainyl-CoA:carnitine CoA-transferase CaiB-like acyl-CoA transferase